MWPQPPDSPRSQRGIPLVWVALALIVTAWISGAEQSRGSPAGGQGTPMLTRNSGNRNPSAVCANFMRCRSAGSGSGGNFTVDLIE